MRNESFPAAFSESGEFLLPKGQSSEELLQEFQQKTLELPEGAVLGTSHYDYIETAEKLEGWSQLQLAVGTYPHDVLGVRKDGKVVDHLGKEVEGFENMEEIDVTLAGGTIIGLNKEGKLIVSEDADVNFKKLVEKCNNAR